MSVMSSGFFASQATAALQVMVWPLVAFRESRKAVDIFLVEDRVSELNIIKYLKLNKLQLIEVLHSLGPNGLDCRCTNHMKWLSRMLLGDFQTG